MRRLVLAVLLAGAVLVPLYLFVFPSGADESLGLANARLVDTPASPDLNVGLKDGELAPDFEMSTSEGSRFRLSDLRGRPVVVSFFALWCGSCLSEMPVVKAAQEERGLDSFTVLAINTGESRERAMEFIDIIDAPFLWGLDFDLTVSDAYGVHGLPYTIFIDADGIVRTTYTGATNKSRLSTYLDAMLASAKPAPLPNELKFVTNIPREHVLHVDARGDDQLVLTSRRLRCDYAYCADSIAAALRGMPGVVTVLAAQNPGTGEPALEVRFAPSEVSQDAIVTTTVAALSELDDPLFRATPLDVRFTDS